MRRQKVNVVARDKPIPAISGAFSIPVEILSHICSFLDVKSVICCSEICRDFRAATLDEDLWKLLGLRDFALKSTGSARTAYIDAYTKKLLHRRRYGWKKAFEKCHRRGIFGPTGEIVEAYGCRFTLIINGQKGKGFGSGGRVLKFPVPREDIRAQARAVAFSVTLPADARQSGLVSVATLRSVELQVRGNRTPVSVQHALYTDVQKWQMLYSDKTVMLMVSPCGLYTLGLWTDGRIPAFIHVNMHHQRLIPILHSDDSALTCTVAGPRFAPHDHELFPQLGLIGYQVAITLRGLNKAAFELTFRQVDCTSIHQGKVELVCIGCRREELRPRSDATEQFMRGVPALHWKTDAFTGSCPHLCIADITAYVNDDIPVWFHSGPMLFAALDMQTHTIDMDSGAAAAAGLMQGVVTDASVASATLQCEFSGKGATAETRVVRCVIALELGFVNAFFATAHTN
eukprot:TRINITY_DN9756_c0_g1_i1.p1 TRINITY_DN9756_c0_g1~~TRINITY_DN9756_c0_g1_i1.p1  ORF type:complete len:458 (-),score=60.68 TRINITY_DN9756_c0_g1_i1:290-1663(-)